ncbi:Nucleoside transporter family protein [Tritrichomonas foetus]|uniref:Nucleoside transporter family protein n=1 Tax=Tritrichomonas foetus TaxID=1144522 RepID=A0A1J4JYL9_9EUKA|nr:Nucleoside transporter family protein [Tritrichomonas foetus]|eukprot:OHT03568.1 Nucleoside transporter family protein [Tritrichomonas foetus]
MNPSIEEVLNKTDSSDEQLPQSSEKSHQKIPNILFFFLGNASLLAYNIAINAIDVFSPLFEELNINIGADISRAYNIPSSIMSFLLIFFKPTNLRISISTGLIILILVMCIMPALFAHVNNISTNALYWSTVILLGITGVFSSLVFSSTYAFASQSGESAGAAVSSGNGACGVIAAALRIITKLALSKKSDISSIIYYSVTAVILVCTLIYFLIISHKNETVKSHLVTQKSQSMCSKELFHTISIIWVEWTSVALNFVITLILFPGYTTDIRQGKLKDWAFVLVTTVFCIFDWVGRYLPAVKMIPARKFAWIPVTCRLIFFLIFMVSIQGVVNLGEPYWTICWQMPFALTNGYCGTVSLIYGSNHEQCSMEQRKQASFLISFAINAGILLAMFLTYVMPAGKHLE